VRSSGDQVILEGEASDGPTVDRAVEIARTVAPGGVINATRVASPQQVMLKVRFVEVNRSAARELGFRWDRFGRNQIGVPNSQIGRGLTETSIDKDTGMLTREATPAIAGIPFATILSTFGGWGQGLDLTISALEEKGLVRRLAEPNLVALSGDTAEFHAGGKIPIVTATSTGAGFPTTTTTFEEFGVRLKFTPTVLSNGLINLRLEPEVSDIDRSLAVPTGGGLSAPGITVRRARTAVELRDGQSFALAGLLQNVTDRDVDQLPWLGSIPIIGAVFRSTAYRSRETELVVIVTPHLVRPGKPGDLIATPLDTKLPANDADLFLSGKLEVDKPANPGFASPAQQWILANREKIVGPYGHMLTAPGVTAGVRRAAVKPAAAVRTRN
jgi:pilus assembly protein CpaC